MSINEEKVYLSLGGNIGKTIEVFQLAIQKINAIDDLKNFSYSAIYQTSPVSPIPQNDFLNMVLSFDTNLSPKKLFHYLEEIERDLGKIPKPKEFPRIIDIDILYYGNRSINSLKLIIPHPQVLKRLFVLLPLREITNSLPNILNLENYLQNFKKNPLEKVKKLYAIN